MMKLLGGWVRGLHWAVGITVPTPEEERRLVFVWIGIIVFMCAFLGWLLYIFG